jgi:hypothetical protein
MKIKFFTVNIYECLNVNLFTKVIPKWKNEENSENK